MIQEGGQAEIRGQIDRYVGLFSWVKSGVEGHFQRTEAHKWSG